MSRRSQHLVQDVFLLSFAIAVILGVLAAYYRPLSLDDDEVTRQVVVPQARDTTDVPIQRIERDVRLYVDRIVGDSVLLLRITPPSWYADVREDIERCSGQRTNPALRYYVAQREVLGIAVAFHFRDYVVFGLGREVDRYLVGHEMLHDALTPIIPPPSPLHPESFEENTQRTHPAEYFGGRCKRYVVPPL